MPDIVLQPDGGQIIRTDMPLPRLTPNELLSALRTTVYDGMECKFGDNPGGVRPVLIIRHAPDITSDMAANRNGAVARTISGPGNADAVRDVHHRLCTAVRELTKSWWGE